MKKLYIDFDGVILDTITVSYQMMDEMKIDKKNYNEILRFYQCLNWRNILSITPIINDSINCIKKILDSGKFDVSILTHINSYDELIEKIKYINKKLPGVTIIGVPKIISKTKMVNPKDSILIDDYTSNLREWERKGGIPIKFSKKIREYEFPIIDKLDKILELEKL